MAVVCFSTPDPLPQIPNACLQSPREAPPPFA